MDPHNVRRLLNSFTETHGRELEVLGIDAKTLTLKAFRKTAATTVAEELGDELASEMLGHADLATTRQFYKLHSHVVPTKVSTAMDEAFAGLQSLE